MKKLIFLMMAAFLVFGCSQEDECELAPGTDSGGDVVQISAMIADLQPLLKTTITNSTAAWANNDAIGLFCPQAKLNAAANVQYSVAGLPSSPVWSTTSKVYWLDGTTAHKFTAYAPYAAGNADAAAVVLPALTPQTGTITPAQDFLISNNLNTTGTTRVNNVALIFKHALSLIELKLRTGDGVAQNTKLANVVMTGGTGDPIFNTDATSKIALATGTITKGTTANTLTVTPGTSPTLPSGSGGGDDDEGDTKSVYILLLPGTYTAPATFTSPTLQFNLKEGGSTDLAVPAIGIGTTAFTAGKKYTYTVTISRTAITISTPTITPWTNVPGGDVSAGI